MTYGVLLDRTGVGINWNTTDPEVRPDGAITVVGDDCYLVSRDYAPDEFGAMVGETRVYYIGTTSTRIPDPADWVEVASCGAPDLGAFTESGDHILVAGSVTSLDGRILVIGQSYVGIPSPPETWVLGVSGTSRTSSSFSTIAVDEFTESGTALDGEQEATFRLARHNTDEITPLSDAGGIFVAVPYSGTKLADEPDGEYGGAGSTSRNVGWPGYIHAYDPTTADPTTETIAQRLFMAHNGAFPDAVGKINQNFDNVPVPFDFWDPTSGTPEPTWGWEVDGGSYVGPIPTVVQLWANDGGGSNVRIDDSASGPDAIFYSATDPLDTAHFYDTVYTGPPVLDAPSSYFYVNCFDSDGDPIDNGDIDYDHFRFWIDGSYDVITVYPELSPYRFISAQARPDEESVDPDDCEGEVFSGGSRILARTDRLLDLAYWSASSARYGLTSTWLLMLHWEGVLAVLVAGVTRQYPRDDNLGVLPSGRVLPRPKHQGRVVGDYQ